jgi:hypothetical protein
MNPTTLRPAVEALTGRDEWGRPTHLSDLFNNTVKGWTPIVVQKWIKNPQDYRIWDSILQSVGVSNIKSYSPGARAAHDYVLQSIPQTAMQEPSKVYQLEKQVAAGQVKPVDIYQMEAKGQLTAKQVDRIVGQESKLSDVQRDFKRLPIEKALEFFPQYNPDEQSQLRPILARKAVDIVDLDRTPEQKRALAQAARAALAAVPTGKLKLKGTMNK